MDWKDLPKTKCLRGNDAEMLQFAVDRVRQQFAWKTGGLDAEQLRRQHPPSTMTLAGLIKLMAFVEDGFTARAAEQPLGPPWDTRSWVANDRWQSSTIHRSFTPCGTEQGPDSGPALHMP